MEDEEFCYLTTTGRHTGNPHSIEIWFGMAPGATTIYMLAGGHRSDWVRNIVANPAVQVRSANYTISGQGRIITDPAEELLARQLVVKKYYQRDTLHTTGWEAEALPVAIDLVF